MHPSKINVIVLSFLVLRIIYTNGKEIRATNDEDDDEQNSSHQEYSADVDEGSCICGLNKDILVKIESIVAQASKQQQSCSIEASQHHQQHDGHQATINPSRLARREAGRRTKAMTRTKITRPTPQRLACPRIMVMAIRA